MRTTSPRSERYLRDGVDDLVAQAREAPQEIGALALEALDHAAVLVGTTLILVQPSWLKDLRLVDPRHRGGDEVAEVGILLPLDRALGDALDDRRRVLDPHLPRALVVLRPADAAGVHHVDLERVL